MNVDADYTTELLRRAVQTPSITGSEGAIGELFRDELEALGLDDVELFEFRPGRPNVVATLKGAGGGPGLLLAGHIDTVHVQGWEERWRGTERESPFSAAVVDGELWGRGAADMKAGIVASIAALKAIRDAGLRLRGDVVVAFVGDEESGEPGSGYSDGMKAVAGRLRAGDLPTVDFAVYTEPTTLDVYTAQMGFMTADLTVLGRSAYFGTPWLGVDALRGAHKLLADLFAYSEELWERGEHELVGRAFLLVTGIEGGGYIAVPERCRLSVIRKILPGETLDAARSELDRLVARAGGDGLRTEITYTAPRDHAYGGTPAETPPDLAPVRRLVEAVRAVTGERDVVRGAPYWSEIPILGALGIPGAYCGPGDITNCHTVEERVQLAEVADAARIFAAFITAQCGVEGDG
jgi:acetylornithine deacetylase